MPTDVNRDLTETITGEKTFTANNTFTGVNSFSSLVSITGDINSSGDNLWKGANSFTSTVSIGGVINSSNINTWVGGQSFLSTLSISGTVISSNINTFFGQNSFLSNVSIGGPLNVTGVSKFGSATDYLGLSSIGNLTLNGEAVQWDDMRVPVTSTRVGGSKDPGFAKLLDNGDGSQGVFAYHFDDSAEEELYFTLQLPHSYKANSTLHPHVHWTPTATGATGAKVAWGMEYSWADLGESYSNTTIIYGDTPTANDTRILPDKHYLTELPKIGGHGNSVSSMMICRIFRDATGSGATDNFAGDAALLEVDFHYEIDSFGSNTEYVK